ncbi:MAG: hypothetical protein B6D59_02945 [Campylobacteraceae bacterium 4484_4]|nr:MAG: hypothetical protein B6D59_02945 [Campylobacteraceae bacterium 4484_4]
MKRNTFFKTVMISAALSAMLTGCGGGAAAGDGNDDDAAVTVSGNAVDGYLRNAFVCLDINQNSECDTGEPYTKTEADGAYELDISGVSAEQRAVARLLVTGGVDVSSGEQFTGLLQAPLIPDTPVVNITPITTIVAAKTERNEDAHEAMRKVARSLGIENPEDINKDPLKLADKKLYEHGLKIQKALEVIAEAIREHDGRVKRAEAFEKIAQKLAERLDGEQKEIGEALEEVDFDQDDMLKNVDSVKGVAVNLARAIDVGEGENPYEAGAMADALKKHIIDNDFAAGDIGTIASQFRSDKTKEMAKRILKLIRFEGDETARENMIRHLKRLQLRFDTTIEELRDLVKNSTLEEEVKRRLLAKIDEILLQKSAGDKGSVQIEGVDFYSLEFDRDEDKMEPRVEKIHFEKGVATFVKMDVDRAGNFIPADHEDDEHEELVWDNATAAWVSDHDEAGSESLRYQVKPDGTLYIPKYNVRVRLTNVQNLEDKVVIPMPKIGRFPELTFSEGAKRYVFEVAENGHEEYRLWDPVYQNWDDGEGSNPYTSLQSFFDAYSAQAENNGASLFWSHHWSEQTPVVQFDGNLSDGHGDIVVKTSIDSSLEGGMLQFTNRVIGSWEVVQKGNSELLVLHSRMRLSDHEDDDEAEFRERIYSVVNGEVRAGAHFREAARIHTEIVYNSAAAETIKNYLIANLPH